MPRRPEPPPEARSVHRPQLSGRRSAARVKGGEAAERSEGTLDAGEHRGLIGRAMANAKLPTDSAEEPEKLGTLERAVVFMIAWCSPNRHVQAAVGGEEPSLEVFISASWICDIPVDQNE